MKRCLKCQSTDIIPDYEFVPGLPGRQMYLKCHMCGGRNIEEVDSTSLSSKPQFRADLSSVEPDSDFADQFAKKHNFEIFEREESSMSKATRYDQAFKSTVVEHALKVEKEKGGFNYGDAERIGKERGCSGASVWQWWKKRKQEHAINRGKAEPPKQKETPAPAEESPTQKQAEKAILKLIDSYRAWIENTQKKIETLESVLKDLAA